jgi:hypothetical protein
LSSIVVTNSPNLAKSAFSSPLIGVSFRSSVSLVFITSAGPHMVPKLPSPVQRGQLVMQAGVMTATSAAVSP